MADQLQPAACQDASELTHALQEFETCLTTPCVPGEWEQWTDHARKSLDELALRLRHQVQKVHSKQIAEIGEEDPELFARVKQLKEHDQTLLEEAENLNLEIERLARRAPQVEPDEAKAREDFKKFSDAGLWFVINVRKQEAAIATWLMEAFARDRGTGD